MTAPLDSEELAIVPVETVGELPILTATDEDGATPIAATAT
jgi:hypothetical protein